MGTNLRGTLSIHIACQQIVDYPRHGKGNNYTSHFLFWVWQIIANHHMQSISFASGGDPVSVLGIIFFCSCLELLRRSSSSKVCFLGYYQERLLWCQPFLPKLFLTIINFHFIIQELSTILEALAFLRGNETASQCFKIAWCSGHLTACSALFLFFY